MKKTLKSSLKRIIVFSMALVTVALTFLQPTSATVNTPEKYLKDVTLNEFLSDVWLDNLDYYSQMWWEDPKRCIEYYATDIGYTGILGDEIKADKSLIASIGAWEALTFIKDPVGGIYEGMTTSSRYEIILIEMLRQVMKDQDFKEVLNIKGENISSEYREMITAQMSHMGIGTNDKVSSQQFFAILNDLEGFVDLIMGRLSAGMDAKDISLLAEVQSMCSEICGKNDVDWILGMVECIEKNIKFWNFMKQCSDIIEAGSYLGDQVFIIMDLLEKMVTYYELSNLNDQYIEFLDLLYTNSENSDLKSAILQVKTSISSTSGLFFNLLSELVARESTELIGLVWDEIVMKSLKASFPWIAAINFAFDATMEILNVSFGTDDNIESVYTLMAFVEIHDLVQDTFYDCKNIYLENENSENAALFVASVDILFIVSIMDCEYAGQYIQDITTNGKLTQFLMNQEEKETFKEMIEAYKEMEVLRGERYEYIYSGVMPLYSYILSEQQVILIEEEEKKAEAEKQKAELEEQWRIFQEQYNQKLQDSTAYSIASGQCGADVYWYLYQDGRLVISGNGNMYNYTSSTKGPWYDYRSDIKNVIISSGVTSIGDYAFSYCSSLTNITIPDSVTSIGYGAFNECSSLTSVTIPNSVTNIGNYAFYDCSSLTSVTIPNSVTNIGNYAFYDCSSLTSVTIPDSVTIIGDGAFYDCSSLTNITIPDSVTSIGNYAFSGCSSLTNITIPDSVTSIGDGAFNECSSLTSITIGDGVTSIGNYAFIHCTSLTNITIPNSVTSIGNYAFYGCTSLTNIMIPDSVTSIGEYTFFGCSSLTSVTIPDSVTSIDYYAFENCSALTSIDIPDSVISIGWGVFNGCDSMESIAIPFIGNGQDRTHFDYIFSTLLDFGYISYLPTSLKTVIIKNGVTNIADSAFDDCSSLTSITIPNSVTSIANNAFSNCTNLKTIYLYRDSYADNFFSADTYTKIYLDEEVASPESDFEYTVNDDGKTVTITKYIGEGGDVIIPSKIAGCSVTGIGNSAFSGCINLVSVKIPDSVISIGHFAFDSDNLTTVAIGKGVSSIGNFVFCGDGKLKVIEVDDDNEYYCDIDGVLFTKDKKTIVAYPGGKATTYSIPYGVEKIGARAFSFCSNLTDLTIPNSVKSIGDYAFVECYSLSDLTFPNSITTIGVEVFRNCDSFKKITIPNSITSIGVRAFRDCNALEQVLFKSNTTYIGDSSFANCDSLKTIYCHANSTASEYFSDEDFTKIYLEEINFGDINGDGEIDSRDAVLLAQFLAKWKVTLNESTADCNADDAVDSKDAVLLAQYLAKWSVELG